MCVGGGGGGGGSRPSMHKHLVFKIIILRGSYF